MPRDQVRSVRFNGWMGSKRRLISGLADLGVGGAIGAAVGYGLFNDSEGPMIILAPLIGVGIATIGFVAG